MYIKSRKVRYVEHAVSVSEKRNACNILIGNPVKLDYFGHLSLDERTVLK
jgi:hypothetical protein